MEFFLANLTERIPYPGPFMEGQDSKIKPEK